MLWVKASARMVLPLGPVAFLSLVQRAHYTCWFSWQRSRQKGVFRARVALQTMEQEMTSMSTKAYGDF